LVTREASGLTQEQDTQERDRIVLEDNIRKAVKLPYMSFGSDAPGQAAEGLFLQSSAHPRTYGNVARLLTFVRAVTFDRPIRASRQSVRDVMGTILTAMQSGGFVSVDTRAALIGFAQRAATWAEAAGWSRAVTSRDVGLARGGAA
jgi:hypothetical protein